MKRIQQGNGLDTVSRNLHDNIFEVLISWQLEWSSSQGLSNRTKTGETKYANAGT
jgi:hypothetical protein